jgi:hypothetical protein
LTFLTQPDEGTHKLQESHITPPQLLELREDAMIMLDLVNETFHQMPLSVEVLIILARLLTSGPGRNYWNPATLQNRSLEVIGIIGPVTNGLVIGITSDQRWALGDVMALPTSKNESQGVAQGINAHMDRFDKLTTGFGAEPTPTSVQILGCLAPF